MAIRQHHLGLGTLLGALLASAACKDDSVVVPPLDEPLAMVEPGQGGDGTVDVETMVPGDGESDFISDVSAEVGGGRGVGAELAVDSAAPPTAAGNVNQDNSGGASPAQRAISEADILQLNGDRLYALSRFSGLSIIDVSNPAALRLEGVYRSAAEPFEMYVQDGLVFAMFNGWYSYQCNEQGACSWQQTSRMQAIDARDPANIQLLADHEVPGAISDSRRVGDVLYLATHEWGGCWGCQTVPNTTVTSFNVANPGRLTQVDQLRLPSPPETYIGERSISVTNQRIYISGWEWRNDSSRQAGSIQVVDISDPYGALLAGDKFDIAGQIQSRWQMDEHDGVLRVISQPGGWGGGAPPVLETFRVNSSADLVRAGSVTMQLPRPNEVLQSARFDGERAYAITFEQRDPLLTFDLSDPANPTQRGLLEMPGWVYHMEPRGDRMYALGFDQENPDGALNVSLFNVADLDNPTLLSRVNFGGDWGSFAEGQNQIHKAFTILEDQGMILVPYSGGSYDEATCTSSYGSGIQLIDIGQDALAGRGVAPQVGSARRALVHREHLFGIGDNAVQTFNIENRDAPVETAQLDVARNVTAVRVLGDHLMRFGVDWWTQQTILDMTPLAQAGNAEPQAEIDLSQLIGGDTWSCGGGASWGGEVFTKGNFAYVPRYTQVRMPVQRGPYGDEYQYEQHVTFYTVDMSDSSQPRVVGSFSLDPLGNNSWFAGVVQTDNTLLVGRSQGYFRWSNNEIVERPSYSYDVIDLADPSSPRVAQRFQVPASIAGGGWGYFPMMCTMDMGWGWGRGGYDSSVTLTDGDLVVSQHSEPLDDGSGRVRYYLDRIDVSNPDQPVVLPDVNIPGTALHFNAATGEVVTVDYQMRREAGDSWQDCSARGAYGYYNETNRHCEVYRRTLNALVLEGDRAVRTSQLWLDQTRRVSNIAVSDSRVFFTTTAFPEPYDNGAPVSSTGGLAPAPQPVELSPVMLETLRLDGGQLVRLPSTELRQLPKQYWYGSQLLARGDRVFETFDNRLTVVDTSDGLPPAQLTHELPGWGCGSLEVSGNHAYCAIGPRGVEVIDMSSLDR